MANDLGLVFLSLRSAFRGAYLDLGGGLAARGLATLALGYGSTQPNTGASSDTAIQIPSRLYAAAIPIIGDSFCAAAWRGFYNASRQLCAGNYSGGVDTCQGAARPSPAPQLRPRSGPVPGALFLGESFKVPSFLFLGSRL